MIAGAAVGDEIRALIEARPDDPVDGSTISAAAAADLVRRHGLASAEELALLALPIAAARTTPPSRRA